MDHFEQLEVICTYHLKKHYGCFLALNNLDITVQKGDIYGFLGPNGSGKTTTIKLLLGLIRPTSGTVYLNMTDIQKNPVKALSKVGSIVETPKFYTYLNGFDNLMLSGSVTHKISENEVMSILELVGLASCIKQKTQTYSLGMKQRLGIAMALLNHPEIVILDEPTIALDPQGMKEIRELIVNLNKEKNITFFLSTHLLNEVEQICNRVGILNKGAMIYEGQVLEILQPKEELLEIYTNDNVKAMKILHQCPYVCSIKQQPLCLHIKILKGSSGDLNRMLLNESIQVNYIIPHRLSLEEFFIEKTKEADA